MPHQRSHLISEFIEARDCCFPPGIDKSHADRIFRTPGRTREKRLFKPVCFPHQSFNTVAHRCGRNITLADSEQDSTVSPEKGGFRHKMRVNDGQENTPDTFPCFEKARGQASGTQDFILAQGMDVYLVQCLKTSRVSANRKNRYRPVNGLQCPSRC